MSIGLSWLQAAGRTASRRSIVSGGELGQLAAAGDQRVGGKDAGAAGVGHDRQARSGRAGLLGEDLGHVEQLGDRVDPQHAAAPEGGVEHLVAAGERAGVRGGGLRGLAVRPALMTMIGLVSATSRAAERKARASPIDSM